MSNLATGLVWERFDGGGTELLVMLAIADSLNSETGRCDPSYKHLAEKTRTSRATVIRAVERLSQAGHLRVIKRTREDNSQRSNEFNLAPGYTDASAREWLHPATTGSHSDTTPQYQNDTPLVAECDPPSITSATPPVSTVIPHEPEYEPEDEPGSEPGNNGDGSPAKPVSPRRVPLGQGARLFKALTGASPNLIQRELLDTAFERHGAAKFEAVIREWLRLGYRKQNADGMVNVMERGWTKRQPANGRGALSSGHTVSVEELAAIDQVIADGMADVMARLEAPASAPADADRLWGDVHAGLALRMPAATLKAWVDPVQVAGFDGQTLTLLAPTAAVYSWLTTRLARELDEALADVAPGVDWVVSVPQSEVPTAAVAEEAA